MAQRTILRTMALLGAMSIGITGCGGGATTATGPASGAPPAKNCQPAQARASGQPSTAPLKIGTLLPETGSLSFLGPPEFAAVDVAIKEINAAGGVLNSPVVNIRGDSGDDKTDTANQTVDRELGQGAQVIIGAAASGVTKLVIDKITGAGVVEFSPANTSDEFTCWPDKGLYFRTAPGPALPKFGDGHCPTQFIGQNPRGDRRQRRTRNTSSITPVVGGGVGDRACAEQPVDAAGP